MSEVQETFVEPKDHHGNDIRVGDRVIYAVSDGGTPTLHDGTVVEINYVDGYPYNRNVRVPRLKVRKDKRNYDWERQHVTLGKLTNVIVTEPADE